MRIAALQAALGNPTLSAGEQLANIPTSLSSYVPTATVALQSYVVQPGDTWASIAQALYGSSSSNAAAALETALGNPTLAAGEVLTVPSTGLVAVAPNYTVQVGDTWASIAKVLFGTSDPNAAAALQAALGNLTLSAGEQLSGIPTSLFYEPTTTVSVQPYYTVQAGDSWASIAQQLYGTSAVASELQAALGSPALTSGTVLVGLPTDLTYTTTASGAKGLNNSPSLTPTQTQTQSNSAALNSSDVSTTQTQMQSESATLNSSGLPTTKLETVGVTDELTLLLQNDTTTIATSPPSSYTVQSGDTWASIAQRIYGTTDPNAGPALQAAMGSPAPHRG